MACHRACWRMLDWRHRLPTAMTTLCAPPLRSAGPRLTGEHADPDKCCCCSKPRDNACSFQFVVNRSHRTKGGLSHSTLFDVSRSLIVENNTLLRADGESQATACLPIPVHAEKLLYCRGSQKIAKRQTLHSKRPLTPLLQTASAQLHNGEERLVR